MKTLITITAALLLGMTATAHAQTTTQPQNQPNPLIWPNVVNPNPPRILPPAGAIERGTTGMGVREPDADFLFSPLGREPQRNDPTVSPFGPMNNIE
jgi:hypothetical protein